MKRNLNIDICFYISVLVITGLIWLGIPSQFVKAKSFDIEKDNFKTLKTEPVEAPKKRALLIGISKYERPGKSDSWWNLNTELDVQLLNEVLIGEFKFAPNDIIKLQNEQATKARILEKMRELVAQTQKGDIVFIHFSGHGNSIDDDNGDEIDKMDESLIPFDYVSKNDSSKNIRDDEIGKILDELKKKEPGNVTISFDSCYSGTATRGDYLIRGGGNENVKPENESASGLNDKNASYPKDYVFLSATNPRQVARETSYEAKGLKGNMGAYTLGLVKALSDATERTTYRDLAERINDYIKTGNFNQSPQVEGSLDEVVFDGTAVRQERYVSVVPFEKENKSDRALLQIGRLQGATAKSRYTIFSAGTKDPNDKDAVKIAEGEIVETEALRSVIKLDKTVDTTLLRAARAFETQHYYADSTLKVVLQNVNQVKGGGEVVAEFLKNNIRGNAVAEKGFDLAEFSEANQNENLRGESFDIKIYPAGKKEITDKIVSNGFRGLVMERKDGSILTTISEDRNLVSEIKTGLERENRFRVVKGLGENEDQRLKISLRVILADVTKVDCVIKGVAKKCVSAAVPKGDVPRNNGGQAELKLGDYIMLEVENTGEYSAYFTILNLTADGKIAPAFPHPKVPDTKDNFIKAGQKIMLKYPFVFEIKAPLGEESFRVIATAEQTDFSPLLDEELIEKARGAQVRGENPLTEIMRDLNRTARGNETSALKSPLGRILLTANIGKRSGLAQSVPPSWAASSFTYLVKDK